MIYRAARIFERTSLKRCSRFSTTRNENMDNDEPLKLESWMPKVGAVCLIMGIVFVGFIVVASMFNLVVPDEGKYPLDVFVSLLFGAAGGFLGGGLHETRNKIAGKMPFLANADPLTINLCSSGALAAIFLIIGASLYHPENPLPPFPEQSSPTAIVRDSKGIPQLVIHFRTLGAWPVGYTLWIEATDSRAFDPTKRLAWEPISDPTSKQANIALAGDPNVPTIWYRFVIRNWKYKEFPGPSTQLEVPRQEPK
jgi:hypothetical protein